MNENRRVGVPIAVGLLLVLIGVFLLVVQFVPGMERVLNIEYWWPLLVVGIGVLLLLSAVLSGVPALAVPACVVGGVGALLFWQNATGNWDSWAWVWTLIPGFVGIGIVLMGLLSGKLRQAADAGLWLLVISAVLTAIFGTLLGGPNVFGAYWPVLLIALGAFLLLRGLIGRRS